MLSVKQQLYKKSRLEGKSQIQSAIDAGYSPRSAYKHAYEVDRVVKRGIVETMNKMGLTDERLIEIARTRIIQDEGATGLGYFQALCKMKNLLVEKPLIDQSTHEHFTVVIERTEPSNGNQRNQEDVQAHGETNESSRHINLA